MKAAQRWREVDRVFAAVLERSAAERTRFLDHACAGDAALRREVEELLAADEQRGSFLDHPAGQLLGLAAERSEEGGRVGPYRLLQRLGSGGMGTVYLARREDEHYQREVAVKVLRSGLQSTEAHHRFLAERQILARLEHPNIARLYDGGSTDDGRPYLVLERVEGLPVDRFCDLHRLTVDQRLDLFRQICAAVQYAHQNLLVHRDLKPANILVTAAGEPKLLDFGIAKQLAPAAAAGASRTRTGLRVMTPSYASPEQVAGEAITTASDVYALGVLLYELLVGRSPYRLASSSPWEIERAICEQEPERPSSAVRRAGDPPAEILASHRDTRPRALQRRLTGDLDNVLLMALRKDPRRRYGSVAQLSRDLERHRKSLPVTARPDTVGYRGRKFLRRHRAGVAAAAVAAAVATGFLLSLVAQGFRLAAERDKARYALSFLLDTFTAADPYHGRGERLTAGEILDAGANRVFREPAGRPEVQAAVMDAIGEVDRGLGRYEQAEPLLSRALEVRRKASGPVSLEVAESLEHLAGLKADRSDFSLAEKLLRRSLALRQRLLGDDDLEVARTLNLLGDLLLTRRASSSEIEKLHRQALAIAREVEGPVGPIVAESLIRLARAKQESGEYAAAEKLFRSGLAIERKAVGDRDPRLYRDQAAFGELLVNAGKAREAEAVLRRSLAAQQRILGADHPDLASTLGNLASALYEQHRYAEAEILDRRLLSLVRSHYGPSHWQVPLVLGNLAAALRGQRKDLEAIPYLEEALAARRQTLGEEHPLVAQALLLLAGAHRELKQYPVALRQARQALAILEKAEGPDHPHLAFPAREIGRIYMAEGRFTAAAIYLRRSLDIRRKELRPDHPDLAKAKLSLAGCLVELGRHGEAAPLAQESYTVLRATFGPQGEPTQEARQLLAEIARHQGKAKAAAS